MNTKTLRRALLKIALLLSFAQVIPAQASCVSKLKGLFAIGLVAVGGPFLAMLGGGAWTNSRNKNLLQQLSNAQLVSDDDDNAKKVIFNKETLSAFDNGEWPDKYEFSVSMEDSAGKQIEKKMRLQIVLSNTNSELNEKFAAYGVIDEEAAAQGGYYAPDRVFLISKNKFQAELEDGSVAVVRELIIQSKSDSSSQYQFYMQPDGKILSQPNPIKATYKNLYKEFNQLKERILSQPQ